MTAVERADVVVVVIDATEGVTEQDAKIAGIAHERGKGIIIAVNKWDAIEKDDKTIYQYTQNVSEKCCPLCRTQRLYLSLPRHGQRLPKLFETIDAGYRESDTAHCKPVCSMRSCQRPLPCSSRRLTRVSV